MNKENQDYINIIERYKIATHNYDKLLSGKHGGNLLQRYWVKTYVNNYELLADFIFNIYGRILFKSYDSNIIKEELRDLKTYLKLKRE